MDKPFIYLIGGPNGAGKTTTAFSIMPELIDCYEYVNADAIAAALSPFRPQEVARDAGRVMLQRIKALASQRVDFAFETTMASRSLAPFLADCRNEGHSVCIIYIWLRSAELAVARVKQRVESGGHSVPELDICRRYHRSLNNLFNLYLPLADYWRFYDNSFKKPSLVAEKSTTGSVKILHPTLWDTAQSESTLDR